MSYMHVPGLRELQTELELARQVIEAARAYRVQVTPYTHVDAEHRAAEDLDRALAAYDKEHLK